MSETATYVVFGLVVVVFVVGLIVLVRSLRRWRQPAPGKSTEARVAEDRVQQMNVWDPTGGPG